MAELSTSRRLSPRWAPLVERAYEIAGLASDVVAPSLDVVVRVWLAQSLFTSGMVQTMDWSATVFRYAAEPPIPGIPPGLLATVGTGFALICPLLLIGGLATRAAAVLPLLWLVFLQITEMPLDTQLYEMLLLGLLVVRGAGPLSIDHVLAPHLPGSAIPFAASLSRIGPALTRYAQPAYLLLARLTIGGLLLRDTGPWFGPGLTTSLIAVLVTVASVAFAAGLGTRVAALALLLAVPILPAATIGMDSRVLLTLLLAGFVLCGGGALALDRLVDARLRRLFPSLGSHADAHQRWLDGAPRVVIVGAGFGGIAAARALKHAWAQVTIVDRRNYHLFQPLLYQVATANLSPAEIATPIRSLVRGQANCRVLMARVGGIDLERREVLAGDRRIPFDCLLLATGARPSYFGKDAWEAHAPGLKKIDDATAIRGRILSAFERAEASDDPEERRRLLTFVLVGGGPTGVELAGAIAELARHGMRAEFRTVDPASARVMLVQSAARLLPAMPEALSAAARRSLEALGVEVLTGAKVETIDDQGVRVGGMRIEAATVLWAAGVMASPAGKWLGAARDNSGRVVVGPDHAVPGLTGVYALGDAAACPGEDGKPLPGLAAVAKQQGQYVAQRIRAEIERRPLPGPFRYRDWGSMATIGRKAAVADLWGARLSGTVA